MNLATVDYTDHKLESLEESYGFVLFRSGVPDLKVQHVSWEKMFHLIKDISTIMDHDQHTFKVYKYKD